MTIDFSPLENAIKQLDGALEYAQSELARTDTRLAELLRSAAIQAFEFTYDLACKMLRRYLASIDENPDQIEKLSFPNLVRAGYAQGLLSEELTVWVKFRDERNITSHTYDEQKAQEVYGHIPRFASEVKFLYRQLCAHQGKSQ